MFDKNKFDLEETLNINSNWIICKLVSKNRKKITVACTYIPPQSNSNCLVTELAENLELYSFNNETDIIIGGDFNARIGNNTRISDDLLENSFINPLRNSRDSHVNTRGKLLDRTFCELGLISLNGRSKSDVDGEYTFSQNQANSIVDYIWVNTSSLTEIYDFAVEEVSASDHQPIAAIIDWPPPVPFSTAHGTVCCPGQFTMEKFKWVPEKAGEFTDFLKAHQFTSGHDDSPSDLYQCIVQAVKSAARSSSMTYTFRPTDRIEQSNPPWYDAECKQAKKELRRAKRKCKKNAYKQRYVDLHLKCKKAYENIRLTKRTQYYSLLQDSLSSSANPKDFWNTVRQLRSTRRQENPISKPTWERFYSHVLKNRMQDHTLYFGVEDNVLDHEISLEEILVARKKLKINKSPGLDGIRNEFLKSLPTQFVKMLKLLFISIQAKECVPEDLVDIEVVMLFKKGDPSDPRNYRGISLINTIMKLFTSIMLARLENWAETNAVLPESQAGFRKSRSCIDHVFTIEALRQISKRRMKKRKLHLLFVDFARAFDSIDHKKLWRRLNDVGVSAKYIRIFRDMYNKATMRVRSKQEHTRRFDVAEGVLQGELTSPLFFALFISDIDDIFSALESQGIRGVNINHQTTIHVLAYADDLVIIADCPSHLQAKLSRLSQYCEDKGLTVNVAKTKILVFEDHHGQTQRSEPFLYRTEPIEAVQEFTYLGITFCACGKFHKHLENIKQKCANVTGSIVAVILRSRTQSWSAVTKLLDALILSIPLYGAEVWALEYAEDLEKIQLNFQKRLLTLPQCTPGYMLRLETGTNHIISTVLHRALGWWVKVSHLHTSRHPRTCLDEMSKMPLNNANNATWLDLLQAMIDKCKASEILNVHDILVDDREQLILKAWRMAKEHMALGDEERRDKGGSNFTSLYARMKNNSVQEMYLSYPMSLHKKRIFAQLRLHPDRLPFLNLFVNRCKNVFLPTKYCTLCNTKDNDDIYHMFCKCPMYLSFRSNIEKLPITPSRIAFHKVFKNCDCEYVHQICSFVQKALRRRDAYLND
ncbi:unnamed protein product [Orchesella dallaii]|uniref:Reverse transcriptase domain-containing protein n=1 Tax=Orchesella dallaii TaxID=48710 RepID=A0ABP1RUN2_9HEXA